MTHEEQRIWLINSLIKESPKYRMLVPENEEDQKNLLRALLNVRPPRPVSEEFLRIQDEYFEEETAELDIIDSESLDACPADPRLVLWQGDITTLKVDAIVNAANSGMTGCYQPLHSCIDNCIHSRAGIRLRLKCAELMEEQGHEEPTGQAKITPGFALPAKYVIHTVGPIVYGFLTKDNKDDLASCYESCLKAAEEKGLTSIAFCCISTGVFRFPQDKAAEIAVNTVKKYLDKGSSISRVIFNVFGDRDKEIYESLLGH